MCYYRITQDSKIIKMSNIYNFLNEFIDEFSVNGTVSHDMFNKAVNLRSNMIADMDDDIIDNTMTIGIPVKLKDLEKGSLFMYNGTMALKSEYRSNQGSIQAYIVGSGEFFWGGVDTIEELNNLEVTPVKIN